MATYIQGVTDYLPVIQPFQPDYNFLSNVLQTKQSRYDAAHKQLSSVYGTLLNSPMLRDQNIERRDQFFKSIDQDIQRMSGMDLSLQQNQDVAMNVFKGFYEDKNMVKDMLWTKNYLNEQSRGESFKDCVDPEKCGGSWWEGGQQMLDYKAQEFKSASDSEALSMGNVSYVAAQPIMDKAMKAAKDAGFSISYDEIKGDWIVHSKNGTRMIQPLAEFYMSKFGSDPKVMAYKNAQAYLQRKNWVSQNLVNYNNDEGAATMAYVSDIYTKNDALLKKKKEDADEINDVLISDKQAIDDKIKKDGYIPSMNLINGWQDIRNEADVASQNKTLYDDANNKLAALGYNKNNIKYTVDAIDNMVAMQMLGAETTQAASIYANLTAEQKFEANPYALQARQQAFQKEMQQMSEGFLYTDPQTGQTKFQPGTDYYNKEALQELEWQHEKEIADAIQAKLIGATGTGATGAGTWAESHSAFPMSSMKAEPGQGGTASGENAEQQIRTETYNDNVSQTLALRKDGADLQFQTIKTVLTQMQNQYQENQLNASSGTSYGSMYGSLYRLFKATKTGIDPAKIIRNDPTEMEKFNKLLESPQLKSVYDMAMLVGDQNTPVGSLQAWNSGIQEQMVDLKKKIDQNNQWQTAMVDFNATNSTAANTAYVEDLKKKIAEKPKDQQNMDLDIWNTMYSQNMTSGGFVPTMTDVVGSTLPFMGTQLSKGIDKTANDLAKKYASLPMFQPGGEENRMVQRFKEGVKLSPIEVKAGAAPNKFKAPEPVNGTPQEAAYKYIMKQYTEGLTGWRTSYGLYAKSWTNPRGEMGGTDKASMSYTGRFDAAAPNTQNMKDMYQQINAYRDLKSEARVGFGGLTELPESSNPLAVSMTEGLFDDIMTGSAIDLKTGLPKDANRAHGQWRISAIAGHDKNWMGFQVIPEQSWVDSRMNTKTSTDKLIPYGNTDWQKGIVVYLPADKVKTDYMAATKKDMWDFTMAQNKQLKASNPQGGTATLSDAGDQYLLQLSTLAVNPQGELVTQSSSQYVNKTLNLGKFMEAYQSNLDWMSMVNQTAMQQAASLYGEKDPNKLFGQ